MPRPKLLSRLTFRLPEELERDLQAAALRRNVSVNEVILNSLENELGRLSLYRLDYYTHVRPLVTDDIVGHLAGMSDNV